MLYHSNFSNIARASLLFMLLLLVSSAYAEQAYGLKEGDTLSISVWDDVRLDRETRVLPDGSISYPLVGSLAVSGKSVFEVDQAITAMLGEYIPDPEVTVAVTATGGNRVFVLGKVAKSGAIEMTGPLSSIQALSLVGGLDTFADTGGIRIVRQSSGNQKVLRIRYGDIMSGKDMSTNYQLEAGDTILVP